MVKILIFLLMLSFKTALGGVSVVHNPYPGYLTPCDPPPPSNNSEQAIELLQAIKPVIGNVPRFCRDFTSPSDDENDEIIKNQVTSLINRDQDKMEDSTSKITTLEVFQMVAMKKMWSTMSETARIKTFMDLSCDVFGLNKWPILKNIKSTNSTIEEDQVKIKDMSNLCGFGKYQINHDEIMKPLSKYLTKDVIAEAFGILKELKGVNFVGVRNFTCNIFKNVDETIFQNNVYSGYVLSNQETSNKEDFKKWLLGLSPIKNNYNYTAQDFKLKIIHFFQLQKRTKPIAEIITTAEQNALIDYVGSGYRQMNHCLRTGSCQGYTKENVELLKSALAKLKKERGTDEEQILFRGASDLPKFVLENLENGAKTGEPTMIDKAFISTSGRSAVAMSFGNVHSYDHLSNQNVIFVIKAKSCVGVDNIGEDEFICPPGTKFKVKKLKESGLYQMDEIESE